MEELFEFDTLDSRIRYVELRLERDLMDLPCYDLPEGYRFVFYRPGDRKCWIEIEQSAGEFSCCEDGLAAWDRYYGGHEEELENRMVFILNSYGEKVATATAYRDISNEETENSGWLHWVAVRKDHQGRGLSKPLISHTLQVMAGFGYSHCKIPTQTTSWLACKVYLDLGFLPTKESAQKAESGWRIVKALTNHPALKDFAPAAVQEIVNSQEEERTHAAE